MHPLSILEAGSETRVLDALERESQGRVLRYAEVVLLVVTVRPTTGIGSRRKRGWTRTCNGGRHASVRKKFQCVPYSETCSCVTRVEP